MISPKTPITIITKDDYVTPTVANQPHNDLETNIDNILGHFGGSMIGYFETDPDTTTGLTFGYLAGKVLYNNIKVDVAASTIALSASSTNYVEVDSSGTVSVNTSGFTLDRIPLWILTTDGSSITIYKDVRTPLRWIDTIDSNVEITGILSVNGYIVGNNSGDMRINANSGTVYFAHNTGNGQVIIRDGAGGTTNQITLDGNAGTITIGSYTVWNAGNDGSSSILDADTLDTFDSLQFLRSDANDTATGSITVSRPANSDLITFLNSSTGDSLKFRYTTGGDFEFIPYISATLQTTKSLIYDTGLFEWQIGGNKIWHSGNDGAGSGLDADTIDGQEVSLLEKVKVSATDVLEDYLDTKLIVGGNITKTIASNGAGSNALWLEWSGVTFITPVSVFNTGSVTAWTTFDCNGVVASTATHVLLKVNARMSSPDSGDVDASVLIRQTGTTDSYLLAGNRASGNGDNNYICTQGIFPLDSSLQFDWTIEYPGFNQGCQVWVMGYI